MDSAEAADLSIFIICIALLLAYNVLYFTKTFQDIRLRWRGKEYRNLWGVGAEARSVWAGAIMADPKEGITGAQGIRNMVMGTSMITAGITVLAGQLLTILTDPARLEQVAKFSSSDPISGDDALMSPEIKIGLSLAVLFLAVMALTQSMRLSVHLTYLLRAAPADPKRQRRFQKIAFTINRRTSLFFSIGLRLQYAFFPVFIYVMGPLALLIATVVELVVLFFMDLTPDEPEYAVEGEEETEEQLENDMSRVNSMRLGLPQGGDGMPHAWAHTD